MHLAKRLIVGGLFILSGVFVGLTIGAVAGKAGSTWAVSEPPPRCCLECCEWCECGGGCPESCQQGTVTAVNPAQQPPPAEEPDIVVLD